MTRSLRRAFLQGWDLHPAQLVTRHLATWCFYRGELDPTYARLAAWTEGREGQVLDEPATAAALAGHLQSLRRCSELQDGDRITWGVVPPDDRRLR